MGSWTEAGLFRCAFKLGYKVIALPKLDAMIGNELLCGFDGGFVGTVQIDRARDMPEVPNLDCSRVCALVKKKPRLSTFARGAGVVRRGSSGDTGGAVAALTTQALAEDVGVRVVPVGAGVTVGEGHRDYDRDGDRDRTAVIREREPAERTTVIKKDNDEGMRSRTIIKDRD